MRLVVRAREFGGDMAVQRAIPRDLLTGEPLRDDTPKMRVRVLQPPVGADEPTRYGPRQRTTAMKRTLAELPSIDEVIAHLAKVYGDADA